MISMEWDTVVELAPKVFADIDKNESGVLDKKKLLAFAEVISPNAEDTTEEMMGDLDLDNDGNVDAGDWMRYWLRDRDHI
jgi:Ca2+-binding EF-hand superfamily protein